MFLTNVSVPSLVVHGSERVGRIAIASTDAIVHKPQSKVVKCARRICICPRVKKRAVNRLVELFVRPTERM